MINNLPDKTGKSPEEWSRLLKIKGFEKHSEALKYLKDEHGVTHGYANSIILLSKGTHDNPDELVENQYIGKDELKKIYDAILTEVFTFGSDVKVVPKKGSVSLVRKIQFALIKPATKTRIDLGLKLPGKDIGARLENSGPFGTMCTHRVQIFEIKDINTELKAWLLEAYDLAG